MLGVIELSDAVAIYGAALSTLLALSALYIHFFLQVSLKVDVYGPNQTFIPGNIIGFAVTNDGRSATSIEWVKIAVVSGGRLRQHVVHEAVFDQRAVVSPCFKTVPVENKPNNVTKEPRILSPGDFYWGSATPVEEYDPVEHILRVRAKSRNSRRVFVGWSSSSERSK